MIQEFETRIGLTTGHIWILSVTSIQTEGCYYFHLLETSHVIRTFLGDFTVTVLLSWILYCALMIQCLTVGGPLVCTVDNFCSCRLHTVLLSFVDQVSIWNDVCAQLHFPWICFFEHDKLQFTLPWKNLARKSLSIRPSIHPKCGSPKKVLGNWSIPSIHQDAFT